MVGETLKRNSQPERITAAAGALVLAAPPDRLPLQNSLLCGWRVFPGCFRAHSGVKASPAMSVHEGYLSQQSG